MDRNLTVWGAFALFFKTLWTKIITKKWWISVLWFLWFVFTLGFLSAIFGSFGEYETRAGWLYALIFVILLVIGIIAAFRGYHKQELQEN